MTREAGLLRAFYRSIQSYPEPTRSQTLPLIKDYVRYVIEEAWPEQRKGRAAPGGVPRMNAVQNKLFAFEPQTKGQEILHDRTVEQFNQMADVRRQRIQAADTGIAPAMWYVVAIGVLITIVLFWLLEMEPATQFILGGLLGVLFEHGDLGPGRPGPSLPWRDEHRPRRLSGDLRADERLKGISVDLMHTRSLGLMVRSRNL